MKKIQKEWQMLNLLLFNTSGKKEIFLQKQKLRKNLKQIINNKTVVFSFSFWPKIREEVKQVYVSKLNSKYENIVIRLMITDYGK